MKNELAILIDKDSNSPIMVKDFSYSQKTEKVLDPGLKLSNIIVIIIIIYIIKPNHKIYRNRPRLKLRNILLNNPTKLPP